MPSGRNAFEKSTKKRAVSCGSLLESFITGYSFYCVADVHGDHVHDHRVCLHRQRERHVLLAGDPIHRQVVVRRGHRRDRHTVVFDYTLLNTTRLKKRR